MHVLIYHPKLLPVAKYGGTERVVMWLIKGLRELGVRVTLLALEGSSHDDVEVIGIHPDRLRELSGDIRSYIPKDADIVHFQETPEFPYDAPHLITIHGNGKPGQKYWPNTVFVSKNHAMRHGREDFVYNGIDPDEYIFSREKRENALFLAKVSWKVKGAKRAVRLAKKAKVPITVAGGYMMTLPFGVKQVGKVGGRVKSELLAGARMLLFPIKWEEPFGLVVPEAMISGTPVIASPMGAMPELIKEGTGFLCNSDEEWLDAIARVEELDPGYCREHIMARFTHRKMAESYLKYYEKVIKEGDITKK